jgi:methyltransferase family protein
MSQLVDRLIGTRLKTSIDRRVRREVSQQTKANSADLRRQLTAELGRELADAEARIARLESSLQAANAAIRKAATNRDQRAADVQFTSQVVLGTGRRFDRTLSHAEWRALADQIKDLSGGADPVWRMRQAFRSLLDHETRGLGRVAGTAYNIIGKLTVPTFLEPPDGPVLEIGTLYGLFSPALVKQFRQLGQFRQLTVIDPMVGHQVQTGRHSGGDPTGTPVTAQVARHNFALCGLSPVDVRLIEGYSTDADVRAQLAEDRYAVVVVDGDHSEEGVYADLRWVENITAPDGIVIVDDFGDELWPDVERATRRYLAEGGRLQLVGQASTSAYLRAGH